MNEKKTLKVLVAVGSYYNGNTESRELFNDAITRAANAAADILSAEGIHLDVETVIQQTSQNKVTTKNVISAMNASSLMVLDISESKSTAETYQVGYCEAANIPYIVTIRKESENSSTISDFFDDPFYYSDEAELSVSLSSRLVHKVREVLVSQRISPQDRDYIWFSQETDAIHIVASKSTDDLYSAQPNHRNHVYLEQFSDKDTILELMVFLSRNYNSRVYKYTSDEFPEKQLLRDNLVVIGGPGIDDVLPGNPICREFNKSIVSNILYAEDGESLKLNVNGSMVTLKPEYVGDTLVKDYGYFARFPNPFDPSASVVMVHGLHTSGVLGAALAFGDHTHAADNFRTLRAKLSPLPTDSIAFEALFEVTRVGGTVQVPKIREDLIFPL